ncbi:hypothetical protein chmu72 [Choristoneura murinana nucleopolyhedrovirus]|uniref:Uncharacterized protein n=1 Tax=Choristoneura murinana nucleopolyhedrovirus TaxID=1987479 RepID=V9XVD0_9ABAC|nr:hypothetical protein chmu72 [Choristoneura murinana nucleopolyhedrovirus]AHD25558.1 hypothetical protein chmu72 [Choristoneura murinana nucleopolyhedrovirus]
MRQRPPRFSSTSVLEKRGRRRPRFSGTGVLEKRVPNLDMRRRRPRFSVRAFLKSGCYLQTCVSADPAFRERSCSKSKGQI